MNLLYNSYATYLEVKVTVVEFVTRLDNLGASVHHQNTHWFPPLLEG